MVERTFAELVRDLRMRRTNGERPPVLLLGAGASVDAGIGAMDELYRFFGVKDFEAFSEFIGTVVFGGSLTFVGVRLRHLEVR